MSVREDSDMKAVIATQAGGPEVLQYTDVPDPVLSPTQVLARTAAAGVNFIDTYRRAGVYPMPFPHVPGTEGAGEVIAVGTEVDSVAVGDRIAWAAGGPSYAELVAVEQHVALPVPEEIDLTTAAAIPLQVMTAHYLVASTFPIQPGQTALVHAAAGGVGGLLTQLIVARGGRVIATVGTEEKAELARRAGASDVIVYTSLADLTAELPALVRDLTDGVGVDVVYDGVGKATFDASLASLRTRGMLALFGGASGQVPPFDLQRLNASGSLFITRPTLGHHTLDRAETMWRAGELFDAVVAGSLAVPVGQTFPLANTGDAHRALEGRATTGKVLLIP